jgi:hypothetical protein
MARRKVSASAAATLVKADWLGEDAFISLRRMDRRYKKGMGEQAGKWMREVEKSNRLTQALLETVRQGQLQHNGQHVHNGDASSQIENQPKGDDYAGE